MALLSPHVLAMLYVVPRKKTSSNNFPHTSPIKQDTLKQTVAAEPADARQLNPVTLALQRHAKLMCLPWPSAQSTTFENYGVEIDELEGLLDDTVKAP